MLRRSDGARQFGRHVDDAEYLLRSKHVRSSGFRGSGLDRLRPARGRLGFVAWDFQWGLYFGAKLPTGSHDVKNEAGALAERTLQPGTGTTDALFGAFVRRALPLKDMSWFGQALVQFPLSTRDEYKPGRRLSLDTGVRYEASEQLALLLQANALLRGRDSGTQAEPEDSGGKSLWISPGASYAITKSVQAYGFVQLPFYQFVNGVQLVATRSFVFGVGTRF